MKMKDYELFAEAFINGRWMVVQQLPLTVCVKLNTIVPENTCINDILLCAPIRWHVRLIKPTVPRDRNMGI